MAGPALLLGGCSVLGLEAATETFDLTAPAGQKTVRSSQSQFLVPEPVALRALDTERIVVRPKPSEINYYPGVQWSDRLPRLVQSRLIQALEGSGQARAGRPGQGLLIDYQLVTDIRSFEYDATARKARIEISVKLMNDHTGRVIAANVFRAEAACDSDKAPAVVAALDGALGQQLQLMVDWALKRV